MAAEELKRDLADIRQFIDGIVESTQSSSTALEEFRRQLKGISEGQFVSGTAAGAQNFITEFIRSLGEAETQLIRMEATVNRIFAEPKTLGRFGGGRPVEGGRFLNQGPKPIEVDIDFDEKFLEKIERLKGQLEGIEDQDIRVAISGIEGLERLTMLYDKVLFFNKEPAHANAMGGDADLKRLDNLLGKVKGVAHEAALIEDAFRMDMKITGTEDLDEASERLMELHASTTDVKTEGGDVRIKVTGLKSAIEMKTALKELVALEKELQRVSDEGGFGQKDVGGPQEQLFGGKTVSDINRDALKLSTTFDKLADNPLFVKSLPGGANAVKNITREFEKFNFSLENIKDVSIDGSRGITRYSASILDNFGKVRTATVVTDKWGNTLQSTQKNFRNFASAIQRNVGEVVKWTVAIGLVYGTMRKLQEVITFSIEIESKLADVQVVLGKTGANLNAIFESAAVISRELSVELTGVVEGYVLAIRAAGKYADETERAHMATALLKDSMILAKLSGLDQAVALDTLVGALSQTGRELDQGQELLDKWVAVAKEANVSLATLAESFAITSTAAENVGIDLDKLNGIIAAVAEVTTLSATESGNAVRAFVSGFQTVEAERALGKYGIAVRDARGELLSFVEVIEGIVSRQQMGIISDRDVAKISESIGGGARRGAQVNAFIENYARVLTLAEVSANASGDAQESLGIKLATVESALVNLSNAFTQLSREIGERGGFLDSISSGVDLLTSLIDGIRSLIDFLGPATKALTAFAAAWLILGGIGPIKGIGGQLIPKLPQGIGIRQGIGIAGGAAGGFIDKTFLPSKQHTPTFGGQQTVGGFFGGTPAGRGLAGAGIGLLGGLISGGEPKEIGGSIAGAIAGSLIAGPVGAVIGSAMGMAMVESVELEASTIVGAFRAAVLGQPLELLIPEDDEDPDRTRVSVLGERLTASIEKGLAQVFTPIFTGTQMEISRKKATEPIQELLVERGRLKEGQLLSEEELKKQYTLLIGELLAGILDPEDAEKIFGADIESFMDLSGWLAGAQMTREEVRKAFEELNAAILEEAKKLDLETALEGTRTFERLKGVQTAIAPSVRAVGEERLAHLRQQAIRGEGGVGLKEIKDLAADLPTLQNQVSAVYAALEDSDQAVGGIENIVGSVEELTLLMLVGGQEVSTEFNRIAGDILRVQGEIEKLEDAGLGPEDRKLGPLLVDLRKLREELGLAIDVSQKGLIWADFEMPDILEVSSEFESQMEALIARAFEKSEEIMDALGLDETQREKVRSTYRQVMFDIEGELVPIDQDVPLDILQNLIREEGLGAKADSQMQVLTPDISSAEAPALRAKIKEFERILLTIPGFELEPETLGVIFSDFVTDTLHGDNLAIQLALRDLIKVNEDQLEGIFNIPEGMSAWIPFTAAMNLGSGGGGATIPEVQQELEQELPREFSDLLEASKLMGLNAFRDMERWVAAKMGQGEGGTGELPRTTEQAAGDAMQQLLPESINVSITNDIEIDIPIYIRGDIIQREVRKFLERDLIQTVARVGAGSYHQITK